MTEDINLKEIERKAYLSYYQDGFWEIFMGLFLIGSSISSLLSDNDLARILNTVFTVLLIPFLVFALGKKYITIPRMGMVKFGPKRKAKRNKLAVVTSIVVIPSTVLLVLAILHKIPVALVNWLNTPYGSPLAFGLLVLIIFYVGAYFSDFKRLYIYGAMFAISMFFSELSYIYNRSLLWHFLPFAICGGIFLAVGLIYLKKFVNKYPEPEPGDINV